MTSAERAVSVHVEGLTELLKSVRKAGGSLDDQTAANRQISSELVPASQRESPVRSGALRSSIGAAATTRSLVLEAGLHDVVYAGNIHFGDPYRGAGRGRSAAELIDQFGSKGSGQFGDRTLRKIAKRGRGKFVAIRDTDTGRFVKGAKGAFVGAQKGGPIRPNPFLYRAIDAKSDAIYAAFDERVAKRAVLMVDPEAA